MGYQTRSSEEASVRRLTLRERVAALLATRSPGRFILVGGLNTAVSFGGFPLLYLAIGNRVGYLPVLVVCSVFNPLFSFVTHRFVTFESRGSAGLELGRYLLFSGSAFLASWGFLALIAGWSRGWFLLAQFGFNVVLTIVSFVIVRRFVFPSFPNTR
jgi:putative flippase GtrA